VKRSLLILPLLAILCLAGAGCCPSAVATLTVFQIPWPDEEVTRYTIEDQDGNAMGSGELTIEKEDDTYLLVQHFHITAEQAVQHITLSVSAADLKPVSGNQTIQMPGMVASLVTNYSNGQVSVNATVDGDEQSAEFDIPDDAYDNDEVFFLLRTIPLEVGYSATYTNVVPAYALTPKATVTVVGEEEVTAPAGSFNCYKLELSAAGAVQYMWYGVDEPHYLIKYDNGTTILLLSEHP